MQQRCVNWKQRGPRKVCCAVASFHFCAAVCALFLRTIEFLYLLHLKLARPYFAASE